MNIVHNPYQHLHNTHEILYDGYPFVTDEIPARSEAVLAAVQAAGIGPISVPNEYGMAPILAVHDADFIEFLRTAHAQHVAFFKEDGPMYTYTFATRSNGHKPQTFLGLRGYYALDTGSPILEGTWKAAYWSAQCALTAAEYVRQGEQAAYALCRPPGHHAAADLYGGFCYLNNAAIAARALGDHVAILDIDYHHGNGTQSIFWRDPAIRFCSLHIDPDSGYPFYWGHADERGEGPGKGSIRNLPLPMWTKDDAYLAALDIALAEIRAFAPRYLVVSAGFDTVIGDRIGQFKITLDGIAEIGRRVAALGVPTVIAQEGGYSLDMLGKSVVAFLQAFNKESESL